MITLKIILPVWARKTKYMELEKLNFIIKQFYFNINVLAIEEINKGLINKTFIVEYVKNGIKSKFIFSLL